MNETLRDYRIGMKQFDLHHPNSLKNRLICISDEFKELLHDFSPEEIWDVIHAFGRLFEYITGIWYFCLFAWPTVKKHAMRVQ